MADADFDYDKVMGPTVTDPTTGQHVLQGGVSNVDPIKAFADARGFAVGELNKDYHAVDVMANDKMPDAQRLSEIARGPKDPTQGTWSGNLNNDVNTAGSFAGSMEPALEDQLKQAGAGKVAGMATGAIIGGVGAGLAGVETGPGEAGIIPAGVASGSAIGGTIGWYTGEVHAAWMQSAGSTYREMREEGMDHNTAKVVAWTAGSINAGLNVIGFHALSKVATRAATNIEKSAFREVLNSPMVKQVANNMAGRTAMHLTLNSAGQGVIAGANAAVSEAGNVIGGIIQKHDPGAFTNPAQASAHVLEAVKQGLGIGVVATAGAHVTGKAVGAVLTPLQKAMAKSKILTNLKGVTPKQVLAKVQAHLDTQPNIWENEQGEPSTVVHGANGEVFIKTGAVDRRKVLERRYNQLKKEPTTATNYNEKVQILGELNDISEKEYNGVERRQGSRREIAQNAEPSNIQKTKEGSTITYSRMVPEGPASVLHLTEDPEHPGSYIPVITTVAKYQRKGYASELYAQAEKDGYKIERSSETQSEEGTAFRQAYENKKAEVTKGSKAGYDKNPNQLKLTGIVQDPQHVIDRGLQNEEALDALYPKDSEVATEGKQLRLALKEWRHLNPDEVQGRLNQIASDKRVLRTEERRLEAEIKRSEDNGTLKQSDVTKWRKVGQVIDGLTAQAEALEAGLGTTVSEENKNVQLRTRKLSKIFDQLTATAKQLQKAKEKIAEGQLTLPGEGFKKGAYQTRREIAKIQSGLLAVVNGVTEDPAIRAKVRQYIAKVTTPEQALKAIAKIKEETQKLEKKKAENQNEVDRQTTFNKVTQLLKGNLVQTQGGRPMTKVPAELVSKVAVLKKFLQDKNEITKERTAFFQKYKDNIDDASPEDLAKMQLANMAEHLHNGDALSRNVTAATIAQWMQDGEKIVAQKKQALQERKDSDQATARKSIGAGTKVTPVYTKSVIDKMRHTIYNATAALGVANVILHNISHNDKGHVIEHQLDESESRHNYKKGTDKSTLNLRNVLQTKLDAAGNKTKIAQYNYDNDNTNVEIKYTGADGKQQKVTMTKGQMLDAHLKIQDEGNHSNLREGNGLTLTGDVPEGESFQERVESTMSDDDRAYVDGMREFYPDYYNTELNPVYKERNGVDLPQNENYTPRSIQGHEVAAPFTKERLQPSMILPDSTKTRTDNNLPIKFENPTKTALDYIDQTQYYNHYFDLMTTWGNVMSDPVFTEHISQSYGKGTMTVLKDFHKRFLLNDPTPSVHDNSLWSALKGDLSNSAMGFRMNQFFTILPHGLATLGNYGDVGGILHGLAQVALHPIETQRAIGGSSVLQEQLHTGAEVDLKGSLGQGGIGAHTLSWLTGGNIKLALDDPEMNTFLKKAMYSAHIGAAATIQYVAGGAIYHAELAKGATHEQAITTAEKNISQTQPNYSVGQTPSILTNPYINSLAAPFSRHPLQMLGLSNMAVKDWYRDKNDPGAWMTLGGKLSMLWAIPGALSAAAASAPLLLPGNQNEDEKRKGAMKVAGGAVLGPSTGAPVFGQVLEGIWMHASGPLIGVKDPQSVMNAAHQTYPMQVYQDFTNMLDKWSVGNKQNDPTKIPDFNHMETAELRNQKAQQASDLSKGKFASDVLGLPQVFNNAAHAIPERLQHNDPLGAIMGAGGWTPSSLSKRSVQEKNFMNMNESSMLQNLNQKPRSPNVYDNVNTYVNNILHGQPKPVYTTEPTDALKSYMNEVHK